MFLPIPLMKVVKKVVARLLMTAAVAVLFLLIVPDALFSYTWYLEGSWNYWYMVKEGEGFTWAGEMNSQAKWGKINGQTLMVNNVTFKKYGTKCSFPVKNGEPQGEAILSSLNESDREYMKNLVSSITEDASTVEDAVERIGRWVKATIKYQTYGAADPMAVIKTKAARSVGFSNVFAELLRAAGLGAKTGSCYIPKGYGTGFRSDGGYHALVEYMYPGRGWFACDPLGSLHFTDPYHLLEWGYGGGNFLSEAAKLDECYVVDVALEPKNAPVFLAPAWAKLKRPAFVFRIIDRDGKSGIGAAALEYGPDKIMDLLKRPVVGGGAKLFGGEGAESYINDPSGFSARFGEGSFVTVATSSQATHMSILALDSSINWLYFKDNAHVKLGPCLFSAPFQFKGPELYRFNADFSDESLVKRILLRDSAGGAMKNKSVTVALSGGKYGITADSRGVIYLITEEKSCQLIMDGDTYPAVFDAKGIARVPAAGAGTEGDAAEKYLASHGIKEGPALICEIRDWSDVPCKESFDTITLYGVKQKPRILEAKSPGVVYAGGLMQGESYFLLFSDGNRHIKKTFTVHDKEVVKLAVSSAKETFIHVTSAEPAGLLRSLFYEYLWSGALLPLKAVKGEMLASFPPGEYVFSSGKEGERCMPLKFTGGAQSVLYDPEGMTLKEYVGALDTLAQGRNYAAGFILHKGERIRSADIWLNDTEAGTMTKLRIRSDGFFHYFGLKEGAKYRVVYCAESFLVAEQIQALPGKNILAIDTAKMSLRNVTLAGGDCLGTINFKLLFPCWDGKLKLVSQQCAAKSSPYRCYLKGGGVMISTTGHLADAVTVAAGGDRVNYDLGVPVGDPLLARFNALKEIVPKNEPVMMMRITSPAGFPLANAQARLVDGSESRCFETDAQGIVWAEKLKTGHDYLLIVDGKGYRMEHPLSLPSGGLRKMDVDIRKLPQISMTFQNYDGTLYRSYVERKGDRVFFSNDYLAPSGSSFSLYCPDGAAMFRLGKAGVLKELSAGTHRIDMKTISNVPIDEYGKIAATLFKDSAVLALALSINGVPLKEFTLKLNSGDSAPSASAVDGIALVPGKTGKACISYGGKGCYLEWCYPVKEGVPLLKKIDLANDARLLLEFAGSAAPWHQVILYKDAVIDGGKIINGSSIIKAAADEKGICRMIIPDGVYHLDSGKGEPMKVQISGKLIRMKLAP